MSSKKSASKQAKESLKTRGGGSQSGRDKAKKKRGGGSQSGRDKTKKGS